MMWNINGIKCTLLKTSLYANNYIQIYTAYSYIINIKLGKLCPQLAKYKDNKISFRKDINGIAPIKPFSLFLTFFRFSVRSYPYKVLILQGSLDSSQYLTLLNLNVKMRVILINYFPIKYLASFMQLLSIFLENTLKPWWIV